jgi:hypothetical protein
MRRLTKNSTLYEYAPDLVKEWHPSANGLLTPMTVKIAYPKKVWWICRESHEWRATLKIRMKGNVCPICVREGEKNDPQNPAKIADSNNEVGKESPALITPFAYFESDFANDNFGRNFRKSRRYKIRAVAVLESRISGHWFYTDVRNFSAGGIGLESESPVKPGTQIVIKLDRPLFTYDNKNYKSIIRWCKTLAHEDERFSGYAIGAKFI